MRDIQKKRIYILLSALALALLTIGLFVAHLTPCVAWESNLYLSTPIIYWIGVTLSYSVGIWLILSSIVKPDNARQFVIIGYALIILAAIAQVFLTIIRGYNILNISGDTGTHLGALKLTIATSTLPNTYYPGGYAEPALFQTITGVNSEATLSYLSLIIFCVFILLVCIFAKKIFRKNRCATHITCVITLLLPFGSFTKIAFSMPYYAPMYLGICLLPIFMYLIVTLSENKDRKTNTIYFIAAIIAISVLFYHPTVLVILSIICIGAICGITISQKKIHLSNIKNAKSIIIIFVMIIILFFIWDWVYFGRMIISGITTIFSSFGDANRGIDSTIDLASTAVDLGIGIDNILRISGINIVLFGLCIISIIRFRLKQWNLKQNNMLKILYYLLLLIGAIIIATLVGNFTGGYMRFVSPLYIVAIIFVGFLASNFIIHNQNSSGHTHLNYKMIIVFGVILVVLLLSIISFHPSPFTLNAGYQTTQTEFTAAETLLPRIDTTKETTGIHLVSLGRYLNAIYGSASIVESYAYGGEKITISSMRSAIEDIEGLPHHFGYDTGSASLANYYGSNTYIFIVEKDKMFYQAYYPELMYDRWYPEDFEQLDDDNGLELAYNNGGLEMYIVV